MSKEINTEWQTRHLVESFYDCQHLRIETFNRIVAYVKSHCDSENQKKSASQVTHENQTQVASHTISETQVQHASHPALENQRKRASRRKLEPHKDVASQQPSENQPSLAGKYSAIANTIVTSKLEIDVPEDVKDLVWLHNSLRETEKQLSKRLDNWSSKHPIRIRYLSLIRGIGPIFSSALIAWLSPVSRFDNISKLWSYCGMAPGQKRQKGKKLRYNPRLKTLMWKIASSFEKQNAERSVYRKLYDEKKKYLLSRPDLAEAIAKKEKGAKLHVRLLAMRFVSKRFLANLWLTWRKLDGLEITSPYAMDVLGHKGYEPPMVDKEQPDEP